MRISQQQVRIAGNQSNTGKAIAVTLGVLAMLALAPRGRATVALLENYEEATSGGAFSNQFQYVNYGVDLSGAVPTKGSGGFGTTRSDDGVIVTPGLDGSTKALKLFDDVGGHGNAAAFVPQAGMAPKDRVATFSYDILIHGPVLGSPDTLSIGTGAGQGGTFAFYEAINQNLTVQLSTSSSTLNGTTVLTPALSLDKAYRITVTMNPLTWKYDYTISNLTDSVVFYPTVEFNLVNLSANGTFQTSGLNDYFFNSGDFNAAVGQNNAFGSSTSYVILDNIQLDVVPEPSTIMLFGIGGGILWFRRRQQRLA